MREIKFRAWDKKTKTMYGVSALNWYPPRKDLMKEGQFTTASSTGVLHDNSTLTRSNLDTLMQYTGLKDKNGVEIYESDIVRRLRNGRQQITVKWLEQAVHVGWNLGTGRNYVGNCEHLLVIGNVYSNPELLK